MDIKTRIYLFFERHLLSGSMDTSTVYSLEIYKPRSPAAGFFTMYEIDSRGHKHVVKRGYLQFEHIQQIEQMLKDIH